MADRFEIVIKRLLDQLPLGSTEHLHDGNVAASGYKPDRVYRRRNRTWVVEIESSTSRKGFIGGCIKAQKYFQDAHKGRGYLLFIINRHKKNLQAVAR